MTVFIRRGRDDDPLDAGDARRDRGHINGRDQGRRSCRDIYAHRFQRAGYFLSKEYRHCYARDRLWGPVFIKFRDIVQDDPQVIDEITGDILKRPADLILGDPQLFRGQFDLIKFAGIFEKGVIPIKPDVLNDPAYLFLDMFLRKPRCRLYSA